MKKKKTLRFSMIVCVMCMHIHVEAQSWQGVFLNCSPFYWTRASQWTQSSPIPASPASQLAQGFPRICFKCWDYPTSQFFAIILHGFWRPKLGSSGEPSGPSYLQCLVLFNHGKIKPRAWHVLNKYSATELYLQFLDCSQDTHTHDPPDSTS